MLHVFQSLLWQVCLLFHAILLQQGCPIAGATATGHGGRGWGRQRGPRQGRWSLSILELRTISSFSTWSPPSSGLGHRCRRRTKGQPGPSPGGGHRVRIAGRHPTAILAGPFAVANLRLTYLKSSSFPSFFSTFQTLNSISAEKNSTIIFPVPIDIIQSFISPSSLPPTPTPSAAAAATSVAAKKVAWFLFICVFVERRFLFLFF